MAKPGLLSCGRPSPLPAPRKRGEPRPGAPGVARLEEFVAKSGLKRSEVRLKIARVALGEPGHFSVQDIARKIQAEHSGIGTATIYRNVALLAEAGLLRETLIEPGGSTLYEPVHDDDSHHDHIVCLDCGEIFEFHEEKIEKLQHAVAREMGFREERHRHVIYARCEFNRRESQKEADR